jgi:hypothetical protein
MKRGILGCAIAFFFGVQGVLAQNFPVRLDAGNGSVFQTGTGMRSPITGRTAVAMGDSVILADGGQATIQIEANSRLIFKGPGALALTGDSSAAYLSFNSGTAFLDRREPKTFSVLTFWIKNYMFVPVGTAAGLRVMNGGQPSVAVIDGKVLMQSPTGESAEVAAGKFAKIEESGRITTGALGKKVVAALERWSGVKADPAAVGGANKSSAEAIDQEFIAVADMSPVASAAAPAPVAAAPAVKNSEPPPVRTESTKPAPKSAEPVAQQSTIAPVNPPPTAPAATAGEPGVTSEPAKGESGTADTSQPAAPGEEKTGFELSAGAMTVGDQQWTRIALGIDVPFWKFGVFFDLEMFVDQEGKFSNKGWDFKNEPLEAISRKIRYIRFGHENDPLFVKVGGLSDVTLGYGFIVDRFTNMLHYPDQKLLGVQFCLNDISPVGITIQAVGADLKELRDRDHGGVGAARLAIKPLKSTDIPILKGLSIGATYGYDRNTYAPARNWTPYPDEQMIKEIQDSNRLDNTMKTILRHRGYNPDSMLTHLALEQDAKARVASFGLIGADLSVPLVNSKLVALDLYAQAGMRDDSIHGWGIGAPGVALKVWWLNAAVEYRHVEGRFLPGFFGPYYLDERILREPSIQTKAQMLQDDTLNGVFGRLGFDIGDFLLVTGTYQYLIGKNVENKDQRFELTGSLGKLIVNKIPKVKKLEAYLYKTRIGSDIVKYDADGVPLLDAKRNYYHDGFFDKTPFLYYGYRLGFEITKGATLICDMRFGYQRDAWGKLIPNNNFNAQTAFSF